MIHLYRIELPHACASIDIDSETIKCVDAPPIAKWMIGKSLLEITTWIIQHKGRIYNITPNYLNDGNRFDDWRQEHNATMMGVEQ